MQLVIPSITEQHDDKGKYITYDIYLNSTYFASVRYSVFLNLHECLKARGLIPPGTVFPVKKFFNLTQDQIKQRRQGLEAYMRSIISIPKIADLSVVTDFFRTAQQMTYQLNMFAAEIQIFLPNNESFTLDILSTDTTEELLLLITSQLDFPPELMHHFNLFLVNTEEEEDSTPAAKKPKPAKYTRILMPYESPFLALEALDHKVRLVYHTLFYDAIFLSEILPYENSTEIVYKEIIHECKMGQMGKPDASTQEKMKRLKQEKDIKQFVKVSRGLPYFGANHVERCFCDYPEEREVSIKLNTGGIKLFDPTDTYGAYPLYEFRLSRIKCWRVLKGTRQEYKFSLSFEYLLDKTTLKWVNICSEQSLYMSTVIQTVINEFLMKKANTTYKSIDLPDMKSRHSRKLGTAVKSARLSSQTSVVGIDEPEPISPVCSDSTKKLSAMSEDETFRENETQETNGHVSSPQEPFSPTPREDEPNGASFKIEKKVSNVTITKMKKKSSSSAKTQDYSITPLKIKEIAIESEDAAGNKLFQMDIGDDEL